MLVRQVTGPAQAHAGEEATYRVAAFSVPGPPPDAAARVSWVVRSPAGATLSAFPHAGPELRLPVPDAWAGRTVFVMPYVRSASPAVAVRTDVVPARLPPSPPVGSPGTVRRVRVVKDGTSYYASVDDEPPFFVGTEVRYGQRRGLMNASHPPGPRYRPEDYEAAHGPWAWYLFPTARCESRGHFTCVNTYDRAGFTFGHMQLAAHTPNDNFAAFFRELLRHPAATGYFPDLTLHDGHVHCRTDEGLACLEDARTTAALMSYFNATPEEVDDLEVERAARLMDWTLRHPSVRDAQVAFAVREQTRKLAAHARRLRLHGVRDSLCVVVLDILHQGRGRYTAIQTALDDASPFDALLRIGLPQHRGRLAVLTDALEELEARGRIGTRVYDGRTNEFV